VRSSSVRGVAATGSPAAASPLAAGAPSAGLRVLARPLAAVPVRAAARGHPFFLAHEVVVVDELVAVGDQQIGRRILDADADHRLRVLAQLRDQRRKIGIAADHDERVDVRLRVAEVERVDHHADVGGVLPRLAYVRDLDHLEGCLVHGRLEFLVALPVAVGLLHHDAALEEEALEDLADVELRVLRFTNAERDVLEVAEDGHVLRVGGSGHLIGSVQQVPRS
jgi:hypothetical protein